MLLNNSPPAIKYHLEIVVCVVCEWYINAPSPALVSILSRNMSLRAMQEKPSAPSDPYVSALVFRWNQPGDYFSVKTRPISTLFQHRSARELYDKVTKYVKEEIFHPDQVSKYVRDETLHSAYSAPIVISLDLSHDPEEDRLKVYNFPNNLEEFGYEVFKMESPPLSHKKEPDNIIVALLEHMPPCLVPLYIKPYF
jgi:hypothetical protein